MIRLKNLAFVFVLAVLVQHTPFQAQAQYFTGSIAGALGGAGRSANDTAEESLLNPATISHARDFGANFLYRDGYLAPNEHETALGISLVDNSEDAAFPGAFTYVERRRTFSALPTVDENYFQISVGNFVAEYFSMGFSVIYLHSDVKNGQKWKQWTGVAGLHYNPHPDWGFALVHYNFAKPGDEVPDSLKLVDRTALGTTYIISKYARVRLDIARSWRLNPGEEWEVGGGIESFVNDFTVLRFGGQSDPLRGRDFYTMGYGFVGPRFTLNYAFRKNIKGTSGALHSVDLVFPF